MQEKDIQAAEEQQPEAEALPGTQAGDGPVDEPVAETAVDAEDLFGAIEQTPGEDDSRRAELKAVLEAIVYVLNEPMPTEQIAQALGRDVAEVEAMFHELAEDTSRPSRGLFIREVAGGYQMATKPEHHEILRQFVRNLKQPLKLSQAALETLAVIAYKQPITLPEILEIRGVQGGGVLKTLIDRKLVTTAGRKQVIGKPILYKTTKEFLTQFGLKDLAELPSLKEFEEIRRQSMADDEVEDAQRELPIGETPQEFEARDLEPAAPAAETEQEPPAETETPPPAGDEGEEPKSDA